MRRATIQSLVVICSTIIFSGFCQAAVIEFYNGANLTHLGSSPYQVNRLRLNDVAALNSNSLGPDFFVGDAGNGADNRFIAGFDLSSIAGWTRVGDVQFSVNTVTNASQIQNMDGDAIDIYTVAPTNAGWTSNSSWNYQNVGSSTPWKNASGTNLPTVASGADPASPAQTTAPGGTGAPGDAYSAVPIATIQEATYSTGQTLTATIPSATVDDMISGDNAGLLFRHRDESKQGRIELVNNGTNGPKLTVTAYQEPLSDYQSAVVDDAPVSYLRLYETSGTTVTSDGTIPNYFGTTNFSNAGSTLAVSGPTSTGGFAGMGDTNSAVTLGSDGDNITLNPVGISGNQARTYEGWFEGTSNAQGYYGTGGGAGSGQRITITAANEEISVAVNGQRYGVQFDATDHSNSWIDTLDSGWHHFAVTLPDGATQSNQFEFFIDGVDVTSYARSLAGSAQTINTQNSNVSIGGGIQGSLDEIAVYDRALSTSELQSHYAAALGPDVVIGEATLSPETIISVAQGSHNDWPDTSGATDRVEGTFRLRERAAGGSDQDKRTRAFLDFDLSAFEGDSNLELLDATLTFTQDSRNVNSGLLEIGRVADDWDTSTVAFDQLIEDLYTFGGTNTSGTGNDKDFAVEITDIVNSWLTGDEENNGLSIRFSELGYFIADFYDAFDTGADPSLLPQLRLTFAQYPTVPEPSTWAIALLLGAVTIFVRRRRIE